MSHSIDDQLHSAIAEFVGAFETVFRYDWQYTRLNVGDEAVGANFLEPELTDESEDWAARGHLLESYRRLVNVMKQRGISPVFPLPLENFPHFRGQVW